jgi:uncharacterized repeat protein (TIGR02543 family)
MAFDDCSSLTGSIYIPSNVEILGKGVFSGCTLLEEINVDNDNVNYASENGVLFNKTKTDIIVCPGGKKGEYVIPTCVTSIWERAFYGCSSLTGAITIPNNVTSIGNSVFAHCSSLTDIYIPDSVTSIGDLAFYRCSSLTTDITIPYGVNRIGNATFYGCSSLTSITIPDSVTSIIELAFYNCPKLRFKVYANSFAYQYAINNNIPFDLIYVEPQYINGFEWPEDEITVSNGTANNALALGLPKYIYIQTVPAASPDETPTWRKASVKWDAFSPDYNSNDPDEQSFIYEGEIQLPSYITNSYGVPLRGGVRVLVEDRILSLPYYSHVNNGLGQGTYDTVTVSVPWSASLLAKDSRVYQNEIAQLALGFSMAAYKAYTVRDAMDTFGLSNVELHNYVTDGSYWDEDQENKVGYAFGTKKIMVDGERFNLVIVDVCGTRGEMDFLWDGYTDEEWDSNLNFNILQRTYGGTVDTVHAGFGIAAVQLLAAIDEYCQNVGSSLDKKILITGHSRGAAVANLVAKWMVDASKVGGNPYTSQDNIYAYTFATPNVSPYAGERYDNIFNIVNAYDRITALPPSWSVPGGYIGFWKYGQTLALPLLDDKNNTWEAKVNHNFREITGMDVNEFYRLYEKKEWFNSIVGFQHFPEIYMAWLKATPLLYREMSSGKYVSIECPVDVAVYDDSGNLVAKTSGGEKTFDKIGDDVFLYVLGDKKYVYLLGQEDYTLKLSGYASGEMKYGVHELSPVNNNVVSERVYNAVALEEGKTFVGYVNDKAVSDSELFVTVDDAAVSAVKRDGSEAPIKSGTEKENPGTETPPSTNIPPGTETPPATNIPPGTETPLGTNIPSRTGTSPVTGDETPHASQFSVIFNANGGTVSTKSKTVAGGVTVGSLPTPKRTGYTFNGWFTSKSGGAKISANTVVAAETTFYAQWKTNKYKVTFNANKGKVSEKAKFVKKVKYNSKLGKIKTPKRAGYKFKGWYTKKSGGKKIKLTTKMPAKNVIYYAQWRKK